MKEPGTDGEAGIPAPGADGQAFPFFGVLAAVASLALAVVFPLIKPLAWSVLLSFSVYPLFEKMREGPFRRRSDGFSAAAATGMIVLFAVIPEPPYAAGSFMNATSFPERVEKSLPDSSGRLHYTISSFPLGDGF